MAKTFSFAAIYRTNFIENTNLKLVRSPVKIEIFSHSRKYRVPLQVAYKFPDYEARTISKTVELILDEGQYYLELY